MSFVLLGILNSQASGGGGYWMATSGSGSAESIYDGFTDGTDFYSIGHTSGGGISTQDAIVQKWSATGGLLWSKSYAASGSAYRFSGGTLDSSGNLYLVGFKDSADNVLVKLNSSGVLQWQRVNNNGSSTADFSEDVVLDASGNIYTTGHVRYGSTWYPYLIKYDSSGTKQYDYRYSPAGFSYGAIFDHTGNLQLAGNEQGRSDGQIITLQTDGTLVRGREYGGYDYERFEDITADSSYYYTAGVSVQTNTWWLIMRGNPSDGSWSAVRRFRESGYNSEAHSIKVDSNGDLIVGGFWNTAAHGQTLGVAKINPSTNTIVWFRIIGSSSSSYTETGGWVDVDENDDIFITGNTNAFGTTEAFTVKIPSDGSLTGTYSLNGVDFIYDAESVTQDSFGYENNDSGITVNDDTWTAQSTTETVQDFTTTEYITPIG